MSFRKFSTSPRRRRPESVTNTYVCNFNYKVYSFIFLRLVSDRRGDVVSSDVDKEEGVRVRAKTAETALREG